MEAVELISQVHEKFGSVVCSTSLGNFIVHLQENQVRLFSLRNDDLKIFCECLLQIFGFVTLSKCYLEYLCRNTAVRYTCRVSQCYGVHIEY
jgi:hypothetical protein